MWNMQETVKNVNSRQLNLILKKFKSRFMWLRWLSAFAISRQRWFYIKVIAAKSNILRNKSGSDIGIRINFTCFLTLRPRKRGFLHETGFPLPQRSKPLGWSLRWSNFFRIEGASISITWNRDKGGAMHPKFSNEIGFCRRQPRLVTYATEISLLRSLVASQQ